ncbi:hypothetical protein PF003_g13426 [Phytophthora fragariae]|nr:hypothetical protein PF003_g13426 [Phytophthora fragariae]
MVAPLRATRSTRRVKPAKKNGSKRKDDKQLYLTYSIVVRHADKKKGNEEEIVTKKMPKFIDGGPKDFLEWVYHFKQLTATKHWSAEDKFLNTSLLLEGDLRDAFEYESITDGDVRMEDEFWHALHAASKVVLPVGYSENLQEELWEIKKSRVHCRLQQAFPSAGPNGENADRTERELCNGRGRTMPLVQAWPVV